MQYKWFFIVLLKTIFSIIGLLCRIVKVLLIVCQAEFMNPNLLSIYLHEKGIV